MKKNMHWQLLSIALLTVTVASADAPITLVPKPTAPAAPAPSTRIKDSDYKGLEYEIITPAPAGAKSISKGNNVSVHYTGWLARDGGVNGKAFDTSKEPFQFRAGRGFVIKGWDIMVLKMKVGEKRRVYIPHNLAYGIRGAAGVIPANADLIFDIEVISVTE